MRRPIRFAAYSAVIVLAAACADFPTGTVPTATLASGRFAAVTPGTCTTLGELNTLARALFVSGQPTVSSVLGKIKNLDQQVKRGRIAQAQAQAHEIVAFTLKKNSQRSLGGTDEQLDAFLEGIYCYAGIDVDIEEPDNTFLIMPSDLPQIVTDTTGTGGISFDANPVFEPTLIEFALLPEDYSPGGGPLDTKLDQYPGFLQITKTSATDAPLAKPAVVGVCATGVIPQEVRDRLRLGHGKAAGFEIAPPANADFLSCDNLVASAGPEPLWRRLAALVAPRALHASTTMLSGGGVGGTVIEFSPFAPVDPELSFNGGVGGTVIEFVREGSASNLATAATDAMLVDCGTGIGNTDVAPECRPAITVRTNLGTVLSSVPVTWEVTSGGGTVAPRTTFCGTYGATAETTTNVLGRAAVCWKLGAVGVNSVKATPYAGGDAPAGVTFVPADTTFSVTAVAGEAVRIEKVSGPTAPVAAGSLASPDPSVRAVDAHGNPVAGVVVNWHLLTEGGSLSVATSVTGSDGTANVNWTVGPGYQHLLAWVKHEPAFMVSFEATGLVP